MPRLTPAEYRDLVAQSKPKRTKDTGATNALTSSIVQYARSKGFEVWRQNNTAVYDAQAGRYRAFRGRKGVSDVIGFSRSGARFLAVEVKTGSDRLSSEQRDFLEQVNKAGGIGIEARDFDQFKRDFDCKIQDL